MAIDNKRNKFCSKCGKEISSQDVICKSCEEKLKALDNDKKKLTKNIF